MNRLHLFEIEDQPWCPAFVRDLATDLLKFGLNLGGNYECVVPRLRKALESCGTHRIVDLCSGAGGPWSGLLRAFEKTEKFLVEVSLSDRFPNVSTVRRVDRAGKTNLVYYPNSVDATRMPPDLQGFRTLFTSFHHFRPADAQAILADAVRNRQGIGVFEVTQRSAIAVVLMVVSAPFAMVLMPFIPPFRWSRLAMIPVLPLLALFGLWDGVVSCLRTYSPAELRKLTEGLADCGYTWEIGEEAYWGGWSVVPITYLIGYPTLKDPPSEKM